MGNIKRKKPSKAISKRKAAPAPASTQPGRPWSKWIGWTVGVVGVVLLIMLIVSDLDPESSEPPPGVETVLVGDNQHVQGPVAYPETPPAGGPHNPVWLNCGFYPDPVPSENAVHSLEHGAVWITFQPELSDADIDDLRGFGNDGEVLVSPFPGLDSAVVVTSWGRQLRLDSVDKDMIRQFIRAFRNQTAPEPAAGCDGGIGDPA